MFAFIIVYLTTLLPCWPIEPGKIWPLKLHGVGVCHKNILDPLSIILGSPNIVC